MDRQISTAGIEPVSLAEMKLHLRETNTDQDALISALIRSARSYAENLTNRVFCYQTRELSLPYFPRFVPSRTDPADYNVIFLPRAPLISVTSITYLDLNGAQQTVDPTTYQVDTAREPGRIKPTYAKWWPYSRSYDFNAVKVTYIAGYAPQGSPDDYAAGMPECLKTWIKVRVNTLFENRGAIEVDTRLTQVALERDFVDALLDELIVDAFR